MWGPYARSFAKVDTSNRHIPCLKIRFKQITLNEHTGAETSKLQNGACMSKIFRIPGKIMSVSGSIVSDFFIFKRARLVDVKTSVAFYNISQQKDTYNNLVITVFNVKEVAHKK